MCIFTFSMLHSPFTKGLLHNCGLIHATQGGEWLHLFGRWYRKYKLRPKSYLKLWLNIRKLNISTSLWPRSLGLTFRVWVIITSISPVYSSSRIWKGQAHRDLGFLPQHLPPAAIHEGTVNAGATPTITLGTQIHKTHEGSRWIESNTGWAVQVVAEHDSGMLAFRRDHVDMRTLTVDPIYVSTQPVHSKVDDCPRHR